MSVALAVDIGGTTTAVGAVTDTGDVLDEIEAPTHVKGPGTAIETVVELLDAVKGRIADREMPIAGVGIGVPGIVDETGIVDDHVPHVPELARVSLADALTDRFPFPVFVDNDVNAIALAEWLYGAARGARSVVVLAPGTGFGAGIVLDGRLVRGVGGFGGELGHTPVKFDGRPCWCGGRGCLATYASGRGIAEAARERVRGDADDPLLVAAGGNPLAIDARLVFTAAERGDPTASAVVDEACRALGAMVATVVNGLNPEVIVITGGVAGAFAPLRPRVLSIAAEHAFPRAMAATRITIVPGDKRLTVRGAAALVFHDVARGRAAVGSA